MHALQGKDEWLPSGRFERAANVKLTGGPVFCMALDPSMDGADARSGRLFLGKQGKAVSAWMPPNPRPDDKVTGGMGRRQRGTQVSTQGLQQT
jgi:hypothetical protein